MKGWPWYWEGGRVKGWSWYWEGEGSEGMVMVLGG